jgi:prolipoprotein diacylglyceryltransferase
MPVPHLHLPPAFASGALAHLHPALEGLAYFSGFQIYRLAARRHGDSLPRDTRLLIILAAGFGALIGSKLPGIWTALSHPHPADASGLPPWLAGKTVAGGILGGWLAVEAVKPSLGIRASTGDAFIFPLIVAMIIGRIGCFLAGVPDGTQGVPASVPWAIDYGDGIPRHPSPLYEIAFLLGMALGFQILGKRIAPGGRFKLFLLGYLLFRLGGDFLKPDPVVLWNLTSIQWFCLAGLLALLFHWRRYGPPWRIP